MIQTSIFFFYNNEVGICVLGEGRRRNLVPEAFKSPGNEPSQWSHPLLSGLV